MDKLPLEIGSAMYLANKFGGSNHAALRRYVEYSKKRCALLVLEKPSIDGMCCGVRNYFESMRFAKDVGKIKWGKQLGFEWDFVQDFVYGRRRLHTEGTFEYQLNGSGSHHFDYHYFNNTWNAFVLIMPTGEHKSSRTKIKYKKI